MKSKRIKILIAVLLFLVGLVVFLVWENNAVVVTYYDYVNPKIPVEFDGFKIVQLSDLHNKDFHGSLEKRISEIAPDLIAVTGDLIDRRNTRIEVAANLLRHLVKMAPVYYVSGNHEQLSEKFGKLQQELKDLGVHILDQSYVELRKGGAGIGLMGIADPAARHVGGSYLWSDDSEYIRDSLQRLLQEAETEFNILLSHRPEQFRVYSSMEVDLVFCGHAHGGQVRIPFLGGLVAPNQGLFPKYTEGIHEAEGTTMVVSRGLGNSINPQRLFNRPEVVVVTLSRE